MSNRTTLDRLQTSTMLTGVLAILAFAQFAYALPTGGTVVAGQAGIASSQHELNVTQSTSHAILDWHSFDIGSGERVGFAQPSTNSVTLNRVTGSQNPSQILGRLDANGTVMLVNPQGVVFGNGAQVNVGGLVATSSDIDNDRFMNSDYTFNHPGNPNATIKNEGSITITEGGLATLVGPNVTNDGLIQANLGKVQLGSGDTFTVDLYGDGLINLQASPQLTKQLVANSGKIEANGGQVLLTAAAAQGTVDSLINMSGLIRANSVGTKNGHVVLYAENNSSKKSTLLVSGTIDAKGNDAGQKGGAIDLLGDRVAVLTGALLDTSGQAGGGKIRVGGDYHGGGTTPTSQFTIVQSDSNILANALDSGNGGNVTVWADGETDFGGNIQAKGGAHGGNGGFVETSGKAILQAFGYVDASAAHGNAGTWLLDPNNITIRSNGTDTNVTGNPSFTTTNDSAFVTTGSIQTDLNNGTSVSVTTSSNGTNSQPGNITVANNISQTGAGPTTLTLHAANNIALNTGVSISSNNGKLNVNLNADGGTITLNSGAGVTTNGGNGSFNANGTININGAVNTGSGTFTAKSTTGDVKLSANGSITSTTSGNPITLIASAGNFTNNSLLTSTALSGGWLIYSTKPSADNMNGLSSAYHFYSCTFGSSCPTGASSASGNGNLYSFTPNLTYTPDATTITYGDAVPSYTSTISGLINGDTLAAALLTGAANYSGSTYVVGNNAGKYNITSAQGTLASGLGYGFLGATRNLGLTVSKAALTVTANDQTQTYGDGNTLTQGFFTNPGGLRNGDVIDTVTLATNATKSTSLNWKATNGTNWTITPSNAAGTTLNNTGGAFNIANYTIAYVKGALTILQKALNVSATGVSKTYDGTTNATVTLSDDKISGDHVTDNYTGANFTLDKNVGTGKAVGVTGISISGTDSANYSLVSSIANAVADITQRALTIAAHGVNKIYDGTTDATVTLTDNKVAGDDVTDSYTAPASFADKNVGTGKAVSITGISISGADAGNYSFNTFANTVANIAKHALSVTANDQSITYSDVNDSVSNLTAGFTPVGLQTGDVIDSVTLATNATHSNSGNWKATNGTNWTITPSAATGAAFSVANYTITYVKGALTVLQKALNVSATGVNKTYDGTTNATVTLSDDRVSGDHVTDNYTSASFSPDASAGTSKTVNVSGINLTGGDSANYSLVSSVASTVADILQKALTITAKNQTITYGNPNDLGNTLFTSSGLVSGETIATVDLTPLTATTSTSGHWNATNGTPWAITPSNPLGGGSAFDAANYSIAFNTGKLTINKYALTVSATADDKTYDGNRTAVAHLTDNKVSGDDVTDNYTQALFNNRNAGTGKPVTVSGISISGADIGDYTFNTTAHPTATINPYALTIAADPQSKVYGSADPTLTFSADLRGTDTQGGVFSGGLVRAAGEHVADGPFAITQGTLTPNSNYTVGSFTGANFAITPYGLTVTPDSGQSKVYGQSDPTLTYTADLQFSDTQAGVFTGGLGRDSGEHVATGPYNINQGTLAANSDYTIANFTPGATFAITPYGLTVTPDSGQSKVYGQSDPTLTYTADLQFSDTQAGVFTGALSRDPGEHVATGPYNINQGTLASNSDYTIATFTTGTTFAINPYTLSVIADDESMPFGGPLPPLTYTHGTLQNSDTDSVFSGALATTALASSVSGNYPITQGTLSAGTDYNISFSGSTLADGTLTIDIPADLINSGSQQANGFAHFHTVVGGGGSGTLLSMLLPPSGGGLGSLSPSAGGDLGSLSPSAGGPGTGGSAVSLIQCDSDTPCDLTE